MILDLKNFTLHERPLWTELEQTVAMLESQPRAKLTLDQVRRLHYLYERASAGLARINTFSGDPELTQFLEALVARAYSVIHSMDRPVRRIRPLRWFFGTFPQTFRRHIRAFTLSLAVTLAGVALGIFAIAIDPEAKPILEPFGHHKMDPAQRVQEEEEGQRQGTPPHGTFASFLMTHNIEVSILAMALGFTFGVGTIALLFSNGVILGAIVYDYVRAGQSEFLAGWLLPHGSIEIPAILLAGQAGLVLARALIGHGDRDVLKVRLRQAMPDIVTLILGVAVMLVWAGIVESFLSQYHQPVLPYWLKISFGCIELVLLAAFLGMSGRRNARTVPQGADE